MYPQEAGSKILEMLLGNSDDECQSGLYCFRRHTKSLFGHQLSGITAGGENLQVPGCLFEEQIGRIVSSNNIDSIVNSEARSYCTKYKSSLIMVSHDDVIWPLLWFSILRFSERRHRRASGLRFSDEKDAFLLEWKILRKIRYFQRPKQNPVINNVNHARYLSKWNLYWDQSISSTGSNSKTTNMIKVGATSSLGGYIIKSPYGVEGFSGSILTSNPKGSIIGLGLHYTSTNSGQNLFARQKWYIPNFKYTKLLSTTSVFSSNYWVTGQTESKLSQSNSNVIIPGQMIQSLIYPYLVGAFFVKL